MAFTSQYICFPNLVNLHMHKLVSSLIVLICLLSLNSFAQEETKEKKGFIKNLLTVDTTSIERNLIANPEVLEDDKPLEDARVELYENGHLVKTVRTDSLGKCSHVMDFGTYYTMKFAKAGYVSKILAIDTRDMPEEDKETGYDLGRFKMNLTRYVPGMDTAAYSEPVAKYAFDPLQRMFLVERKFTKKQQKKLAKVEEKNQEVLAQKADEFARIDKEYELIIRDADLEFKNGDYQMARTYYRDALKLKPNEVYPKEQMQKITKLLGDQKENQKRYDLLILQGDNAFKAENYSRAKQSYESALVIYEDKEYPKQQLAKIKTLDVKKPVEAKKEKKNPKDFKISEEDKQKSTGYMSELAKKYPEGLTEEVNEEGSKKVTRRIIVNGNLGVEYKKVEHNWGGIFYFKNGSPTTEYVWLKETE